MKHIVIASICSVALYWSANCLGTTTRHVLRCLHTRNEVIVVGKHQYVQIIGGQMVMFRQLEVAYDRLLNMKRVAKMHDIVAAG